MTVSLSNTPQLVLPHPRMHERRFVLAPLCDLAPGWRHPLLGTTAAELLAALPPDNRCGGRIAVSAVVVERAARYNRAPLAVIRECVRCPCTKQPAPIMIEKPDSRQIKVTDERVIAAFAANPARTVRASLPLAGIAYVDADLPLGGGRYLMQPMVAARLLQAATIGRGNSVLVVGAGTGYEAALAAMLGKSVVALEDDAALAPAWAGCPGRAPDRRRRLCRGAAGARPCASARPMT